MIEVNNLDKEFVKKEGLKSKKTISVLKTINLKIEDGEFLALLGGNGSGKSTLLKCMTGVLKPTNGNVLIDNLDVFDNRKKIVGNMGAIFNQKPSFLIDISVRDNFDFYRAMYSLSIEQFNERIEFINNYLEVLSLFNNQYRKLSFGQRIRCELASILIHNPKYIFLDEPTIGLDCSARKGLYNLLSYYNKNYGSTIIIVTHDIENLDTLCNRALIIDKGKIIYDNSLKEIAGSVKEDCILEIQYNQIINSNIAQKLILNATSYNESLNELTLSMKNNITYQETMLDLVKGFDIKAINRHNGIGYMEVLMNAINKVDTNNKSNDKNGN